MPGSDKARKSGNELVRGVNAGKAAPVQRKEPGSGGRQEGQRPQAVNHGRKTTREKLGRHDARRRTAVKPIEIGLGSGSERSEASMAENPATRGHAPRWQSNVKHQRARATASRVTDEAPLRALRCMR